MGRRSATIAATALAVLLLAMALPTGPFPSFTAVATGGKGHGAPVSEVQPLGEYTTREVVEIHYLSYMHGRPDGGDDDDHEGDDGLGPDASRVLSLPDPLGRTETTCGGARSWTELFYRTTSDGEWALYAPSWNHCGRWTGTRLPGSAHAVQGTIPFDTFYAGGEGPYAFTTVAVHRRDRESGPSQEKARTTVDAHAPQLFVATPVPGSWTNRDMLRWDAQDAVSGVATVSVRLDGSEPTVFETAQGEMELHATEGAHTVLVTATDRAGNGVDVTVPFRFDPFAPSLSITSPTRDSFVRTGDVDVTWIVAAEGAPLDSLRLSVDTAPTLDLSIDKTSYALRGLAEREHLVSLIAVDAAGNIATEAILFGVDLTPPTLTVLSPPDYVNTQDLQLYWVGADTGSGIAGYELALDGGTAVPAEASAGHRFRNVPEGAHFVVIRAFDRAGNVREETMGVTVDRTAPAVTVTNPTAGTTVYGTAQLTWTAGDTGSGIDWIGVVVDGNEPIVAIDRATLSLGSPSTGPHYAIVRAMDRAGNIGEAGVAFLYGGANLPGPLGISAFDFGLLMLILGAIAVAAAYFAVRRRRKVRMQ